MGVSQSFRCFSEMSIFDLADSCETKFEKIGIKMNDTLSKPVQFYSDPSETAVIPRTVEPLTQPPLLYNYCPLPTSINYLFIFQPNSIGMNRLEAVHISFDYKNFTLSSEYSTYSVRYSSSFVKRILRSETVYGNPFSCQESEVCLKIPESLGKDQWASLLLIIICTIYVLCLYLYLSRDPVSHFKYKIS